MMLCTQVATVLYSFSMGLNAQVDHKRVVQPIPWQQWYPRQATRHGTGGLGHLNTTIMGVFEKKDDSDVRCTEGELLDCDVYAANKKQSARSPQDNQERHFYECMGVGLHRFDGAIQLHGARGIQVRNQD